MAFIGHVLGFGYQEQMNMTSSEILKFHDEAIKIFKANREFKQSLFS